MNSANKNRMPLRTSGFALKQMINYAVLRRRMKNTAMAALTTEAPARIMGKAFLDSVFAFIEVSVTAVGLHDPKGSHPKVLVAMPVSGTLSSDAATPLS